MPSVRERFETYHDFASADLVEIYGDKLEKAVRLEANTPHTGFFMNDGKGNFNFAPLPAAAQIAPVMGTTATHLDGDGRPDLVLSQNFFENQRETGRMSGGLSLVILRKNDGSLHPVPANMSGIALQGDARALASSDFNNDRRPDLLFAHNSAKPRFFLNSASGNFLQFSLAGSSRNRHAIGTRLIFEHANGSREVKELHAGGGYLSQQSQRLFHSSPPDNPLIKVHLTWPDGTTSVAAIPADATSIKLRKP
ncbi:MAG: CRTAC1 family protein [Akkermansiaceae bacterium]